MQKSKTLLSKFHDKMLFNPSEAADNFEDIAYHETKTLTAQYLNAQEEEISFIPNFGYGLRDLKLNMFRKRSLREMMEISAEAIASFSRVDFSWC